MPEGKDAELEFRLFLGVVVTPPVTALEVDFVDDFTMAIFILLMNRTQTYDGNYCDELE